MKVICACAKSSAHAHGTKIRGGNFKQFKTFVGVVADGRFATDLQCRLQTSDDDPRTGIFPKTWVTMGNTTCSVTGV